MTKFDQLKERYPNLIPIPELRANVSIIELAIHWGYRSKQQKGKTRPVLEHSAYEDTIIVKNPQSPARQVYQRSGDFSDAGTIIDFVRNRLVTVFSGYNRPGEHELTTITRVLYDYLRIDPEYVKVNPKAISKQVEDTDRRPFDIGQFDIRPLQESNYLTKRCITPKTVSRPEFMGKIVTQVSYFDPVARQAVDWSFTKENPKREYVQFTNIAFPYYDGQSTLVTGLELRNKNVKLHAAGSDRYSSVFVSNPPAQVSHFYVLESVIDVLSHQQLRSMRGDDRYDSVYFSTGGQLTPQQVRTIFRYISSFDKSADFAIHLAFDNDAKGCLYDLQFIQHMAILRFPMMPVASPSGRVVYSLPEQENYRLCCEELLDHIKRFNQTTFLGKVGLTLAPAERDKQQIIVSRSDVHTQISIPETIPALTAICLALLKLTNMNGRVKIKKASFKDFNEDLSIQLSIS